MSNGSGRFLFARLDIRATVSGGKAEGKGATFFAFPFCPLTFLPCLLPFCRFALLPFKLFVSLIRNAGLTTIVRLTGGNR
jgi:hypothetical protein